MCLRDRCIWLECVRLWISVRLECFIDAFTCVFFDIYIFWYILECQNALWTARENRGVERVVFGLAWVLSDITEGLDCNDHQSRLPHVNFHLRCNMWDNRRHLFPWYPELPQSSSSAVHHISFAAQSITVLSCLKWWTFTYWYITDLSLKAPFLGLIELDEASQHFFYRFYILSSSHPSFHLFSHSLPGWQGTGVVSQHVLGKRAHRDPAQVNNSSHG